MSEELILISEEILKTIHIKLFGFCKKNYPLSTGEAICEYTKFLSDILANAMIYGLCDLAPFPPADIRFPISAFLGMVESKFIDIFYKKGE